ncbi:MAG TPA: hypothetical protein VK932_08890 [Kofleriaceae bacterium]|nr:hypothetical protein [Kofleriaceae bacterium]
MADGAVLDASVLINLLGCGAADRVLAALPGRRVVADVTSRELLRHPLDPARAGNPLEPLVEAGLLERVELHTAAMQTFRALVGAEPPDDLGDGEAAAIALAQELSLAVALDDTKARRIARGRFPELQISSSVDLFASPPVAAALGDGLGDAVFSALVHARMRVLPENEAWVLLLLGDRAAECPSLRRRRK